MVGIRKGVIYNKNLGGKSMSFCIYCGKKLEEGEVCGCRSQEATIENQAAEATVSQGQQTQEQSSVPVETVVGTQNQGQTNQQFQEQSAQQFQQQTSQAVEKSSAYLRQLVGSLLKVLKKPVEAGKKFAASADKKIAIGFIVIQAFLSGVFVMILCNKINGVAKAAGSFIGDVDSRYLFSLPKVLLLTVIGSVLLSFAMAALLFAGVKLLKGNTTFWHMVCVASVRSVGKSIFSALAVIISFLNLTWGIGIFILSALIGWIFMIPVMQSAAALSENKQVYMIGAVIILNFVVFYLIHWFFFDF